jgi:hypothetical protein
VADDADAIGESRLGGMVGGKEGGHGVQPPERGTNRRRVRLERAYYRRGMMKVTGKGSVERLKKALWGEPGHVS